MATRVMVLLARLPRACCRHSQKTHAAAALLRPPARQAAAAVRVDGGRQACPCCLTWGREGDLRRLSLVQLACGPGALHQPGALDMACVSHQGQRSRQAQDGASHCVLGNAENEAENEGLA